MSSLPPPPSGSPDTTRLAPSPTGALHLGNARTFLITWALARRSGWSIILRIEDLDTPRVKPGSTEALIDTLRWLGMDWDDCPLAAGPGLTAAPGPLVQSHDLEPYRAAMRSLASRGLVYPCALTRAEIEAAASAPQAGAHDIPFPPHLRPVLEPMDFDAVQAAAGPEGTNWRLAVPSGPVSFYDAFAGPQAFDISTSVGDFVLWTKRDQPSYQLAVVVDDHRQGITQVVRGDDLLDSAARQLLLYRALGYDRTTGAGEPAYTHLPLVIGPDGRRLAKRHGDTRIDHYREAGVRSDAVIGLIAYWSGTLPRRAPLSAAEFRDGFDLSTLPRSPVTFIPEDDLWLLSHTR